MKEIPTVRVKINYEIYTSGDLVAAGYTRHAFVDSKKMKPVRPPEQFTELIKSKL